MPESLFKDQKYIVHFRYQKTRYQLYVEYSHRLGHIFITRLEKDEDKSNIEIPAGSYNSVHEAEIAVQKFLDSQQSSKQK